jgi:predicted peptidase
MIGGIAVSTCAGSLDCRVVFGVAMLSILSSCAQLRPAVDADGPRGFESGATAQFEHSTSSGLSYVVTTPAERASTGPDLMPMVVFLHSLEERGRKLDVLFDNPEGQGIGLAGLAVEDGDFPFVTLSPLCPAGSYWFFLHRRLDLLIAEVVERYPVDPDRVCLMGVSMGAMGIWSLAMAFPHRFAAAAPIAGGVYSPPMRRRYSAMTDVPVWAFHARHDPSIPLQKNERAVEDLNAAGGDARITVIESDAHYIQDQVFRSGELFAWFLERVRRQR